MARLTLLGGATEIRAQAARVAASVAPFLELAICLLHTLLAAAPVGFIAAPASSSLRHQPLPPHPDRAWRTDTR